LRVHEIIPPGGDALIALDVREVEHYDTAISSSVKSVAQTLEALLASGVPDLERYLLPRIEGHNFFHKVSADGWTLYLVDLFVLKVFDEGGLADVRVSNDHHFQESGFAMAGSQRAGAGRICFTSASVSICRISELLKFVTFVRVP
jgi:hypothetical protein